MISWSGSELYSHPDTRLLDHLHAVTERAISSLNQIPILHTMIEREHLRQLIMLVSQSHDLGKATTYFQRYLLSSTRQEKDKLKNDPRTHHAKISALLTARWATTRFINGSFAGLSPNLVAAIAYAAVRWHHGNLKNIYDELNLSPRDTKILLEQWQSIPNQPFAALLTAINYPDKNGEIETFISNPNSLLQSLRHAVRTLRRAATTDESLTPFFLTELCYSLLIDADRKEAAAAPKSFIRQAVPTDYITIFRQKKNWLTPQTPIGDLRNALYQEVKEQSLSAPLHKLFTLTAPTGLGKTIAALEFALTLRKRIAETRGSIPRIVYALPFLSIIDQTERVFDEVLQSPDSRILLAQHHLSDISYQADGTEFEPDIAEMLIETWESEIVVTSFVQLFHSLIGHRGRTLRRFWKLAGAIIVLDEIQNLPHNYWLLFRKVAEYLHQHFGTLFVLMTATQPAIFDPATSYELVKSSDSFFEALDRVDLELDIEDTISLNELAEIVLSDINLYPERDVLVVLNTISAAREFFHLLREAAPGAGTYYYLSSNVIPAERFERIEHIRTRSGRKIIVSTQVIEAGIDIDCDLGYRDWAPADSLVQVAGRVNRNGTKPYRGHLKVVRLRDERAKDAKDYCRYIYDSFLLDCTHRAFGQSRCNLSEHQFLSAVRKYYQLVAADLSNERSRKLLKAMSELIFDDQESGDVSVASFHLIPDGGRSDVFVMKNDEANRLWEEYLRILEIKDVGNRRQQFAAIKQRFGMYLISVSQTALQKNPPPVRGLIGYVPQDVLKDYYDPYTGFKSRAVETEIW